MKKPIFVLITCALAAAAVQAGNPVLPIRPPIWSDEPAIGTSVPPNWVPKRPGHYGLTDWRQVIDATWGPGLPVDEKLAIFDLFWETIDSSFGCFNNLTVNWDSLRTVYRTEIEDTVSRGRFAAIMNHLAMALKEGHTDIGDIAVNYCQMVPGVPLWVVAAWQDVGHFGAGLTPLPDSSLLVYRVVDGHPLGLERGDVVLGYDGRPWADILRELQEAQLPIRRQWCLGSCTSAMTYSLLNGAGMNWHLFDTIDVVKYSTGDTVHLLTVPLARQNMHLFATDQIDIPGVPMPATDSTPSVTYGVVSGTAIGYIYCWRWWTSTVATEFYDAVNALVSDTTLKGMVIDFRYNEGGSIMVSNLGLQLLFRDSVATICFSQRSDPANHFSMRVVDSAFYYVIPGNGTGYDKPIAVLVGPGAVSAGDQVAFRMTFHPRVKTFGKPTNTAFSALTGLSVHSGWYANYAPFEACLASDTTYFLTHREFPVDVPVWHTRDAVANGKDAVVEAAIAWIDSAAAVAEELEPPASDRSPLDATVIRGVLFLAARTSSSPSTSCLLDACGRKVLDLKPGANNVRALAPGVYFVRGPKTEDGRPGAAVRKVVVTR